MIRYETGTMVRSLAGHDKDRLFIIIQSDQEYVYLVDGQLRTVNKPKRKKKKHVQWIGNCDVGIKKKLDNSEKIFDEEIVRAIRLFRR